ncbi:MAG: HAMP domain-containing protein [Bradymonadaceae bacterium]|nr:HAMP domain-containing protein [Lujinxingiaceae bacterium]
MGPTTRRMGFPGGLRAQLLLGLGALLLAMLTLVSITFVHTTKRQLQQASLGHAQALAELLAEQAGGADTFESSSLERFARAGSLEFAAVETAEGAAWQSFGPGALHEALEGLDGERTYRVLSHAGSPHLLVATARQVQGRRLRAAVGVSLAPVQAKIDEAEALVLMYLFVDMLFIIIVGYAFFTYLVVRPIRAIGVATERAAGGDLASPIAFLPGNEFGQVGRSFNRMLGELENNRGVLEERLRVIEEAQRSLVRAEKLASVGQLSAGVAHEVGNPLAAILGYTDILRDRELEEEVATDILDRVQVQVERIQKIVRELLDFSRDDSEEAVEPTDLAGCVEEALHLMSAHPRARHVVLHKSIEAGLPQVAAVHSAVVQVLVNLVVNGADALAGAELAGEQAAVWVEARRGGGERGDVVVSVRDNGPGISAKAAGRIFDPFYTTKEPGAGTGLGLAISLRIMQRFGGDIVVGQAPEGGALFELVFRAA